MRYIIREREEGEYYCASKITEEDHGRAFEGMIDIIDTKEKLYHSNGIQTAMRLYIREAI